MAKIEGLLGYAVVSYMTDDPERKDITGDGPREDVPFETIAEAKDHLYDRGYHPNPDVVHARVVALVDIEEEV